MPFGIVERFAIFKMERTVIFFIPYYTEEQVLND